MPGASPRPRTSLALLKNPEFIVSQVLMIAATIIGVYLAANEGFKKAVQFQLLDADRAAYRHMAALRDEMVFNAETIADFAAQYRESGANIHQQFLPPVRTFVWDSSSEHPSVFEMPPEVLGGATAVYDRLASEMEMGGRGPDRRRELLAAFEEEAERIDTVMVPAIERQLEALRKRMRQNGMRLE
jgi:hypothetical protein